MIIPDRLDGDAWTSFLKTYDEADFVAFPQCDPPPDVSGLDSVDGWIPAPLASDEGDRLKALNWHSRSILQAYEDAGSDLKLDRYTRLGANLCKAPVCLLNILNLDTQWTTGEYGLPSWRNSALPRTHTFCSHTILQESKEVFVVLDAKNDERFAQMPLVKGHPHISFYMGAPLTTKQGQNIGALCVLDPAPGRPYPTEEQRQGLTDIADMIMNELDLRADRLAAQKAKRVFLSSISHELRSPLHGLLASTELMIEDGHLTAFQDVCAKTITNCGRTLNDVIEQVLSFSDSERSPNRDEVFLPTFVEEIVDATWAGRSQLKSKDASIEVLIDVNLTHLRHAFSINRGEIGRIIMNLFGNAIKYTSEGFVSVHLKASEPAFYRDGMRLQYVEFVFADSGKGIDAEFLPRIFAPFAQQDSVCEGFGLGMSLVKQLVENNQGTIRVESEAGNGTQVYVTLLLPAIKAPVEPSNGVPAEFQSLANLKFCIYNPDGEIPSTRLEKSMIKTCEESFGMSLSACSEADVVLLINASHLTKFHEQQIIDVPVVVFAPDVQNDPNYTLHLQIPVGPFKLGRAITTAMTHHEQSLYKARRSSIVHLDPMSPPTSCRIREDNPLDSCVKQTEHRNGGPSYNSESFSFGRPGPSPLHSTELDLSSLSIVHEGASDPSQSQVLENVQSKPFCLCVDDNAINLQILTTILSKRHIGCGTATDGKIAVAKFKSALESDRPYDIVFMDLNMPNMNGVDAMRHIRELEHTHHVERCIIVALTGADDLPGQDFRATSGIDHFFKKPVSMKTLSNFLQGYKNE